MRCRCRRNSDNWLLLLFLDGAANVSLLEKALGYDDDLLRPRLSRHRLDRGRRHARPDPSPGGGHQYVNHIFRVFSCGGGRLSYLLLLRVSGPGSGSRMKRSLSARTDDELF